MYIRTKFHQCHLHGGPNDRPVMHHRLTDICTAGHMYITPIMFSNHTVGHHVKRVNGRTGPLCLTVLPRIVQSSYS
jgi:hypothetical protein